jgi:hypothetical protein
VEVNPETTQHPRFRAWLSKLTGIKRGTGLFDGATTQCSEAAAASIKVDDSGQHSVREMQPIHQLSGN